MATLAEEATQLMKQAELEIIRLREVNAELLAALQRAVGRFHNANQSCVDLEEAIAKAEAKP